MAVSKFFIIASGGRKYASVQFDHAYIPTADQKAALPGTNGTPADGNKYVTDSDPRNTDARTPSAHDNTYHTETYITSAGVTYENLDTNGDVGAGASQVAAGTDARFLTADQKAAAAGTNGVPADGNRYVTDSDPRNTDVRTPSAHDNTYHTETYITSTGVTYENLNANGDVGSSVSQVAAGNDARFPTTDEKAALAGEGTPSAVDKYTCKSYVDNLIDGLEWQKSVEYSIDYVKPDAGAPAGVGTSGELCLNTNEKKLYTYTAAWDAGVACVSGHRYIFKDTGSDASGNSGTYTHDDKIRTYNGTTIDEYTPTKSAAVRVDDENTPDGIDYVYNSTDWVVKAGSTVHNGLSGIQGGDTGEYYHLTADQFGGIVAATEITNSNAVLTFADRALMATRIVYDYIGGFAESQSDTEIYDASGLFQRIVMPSNGSIVKATIQSSSARTAGTLTCEPTIDGTKVTPGNLDLTLDADDTLENRNEVLPATAGFTFSGGSNLGVRFTSDAAWANGSGDLQFVIYVVFDKPAG